MLPPITFNTAYYVEWPEPTSLPLVAIRPTFFENDKRVEWATNSGKGYGCTWTSLTIDLKSYATNTSSEPILVGDVPSLICFASNGTTIKLAILTLELFDKHIRAHVVNGAGLKFSSDQSVREFFCNTPF